MIIAFTGAGISKASGIPTFDEMGDLRTKLDRDYANRHRKEFSNIMEMLKQTCQQAEPNDAHMVLAEYNIPTITMNIDGLHEEALKRLGKDHKRVVEVHGNVFKDNVVLYGDAAPSYEKAYRLIRRMRKNDVLLIVGTSYYTSVSTWVKTLAEMTGASIVEINNDAEHKVREYIENNKDKIGDYVRFLRREELY